MYIIIYSFFLFFTLFYLFIYLKHHAYVFPQPPFAQPGKVKQEISVHFLFIQRIYSMYVISSLFFFSSTLFFYYYLFTHSPFDSRCILTLSFLFFFLLVSFFYYYLFKTPRAPVRTAGQGETRGQC